MNPFDPNKRIKELQNLDCETEYGKNDHRFKDRYIDINTIDVNLDQVIYRVLSYNRLKEFIDRKYFSLSRPLVWKDPYENFILNAIGELEDGTKVGMSEIRDSYYAQCWTEKKECDGLWRNFKSKTTPAVRIKTTVSKLMNEFYDTTNVFHTLSYFAGKVNYYSENDIAKIFQDKLKLGSITGQSLFFEHGLLIKREQFSYENEIRLIFRKPSNPDQDISIVKNQWNNSDYFNYSIEPNCVIEEITIEPWISHSDYSLVEKEIRTLGYTGEINKSKLYEKPFFILKL